MPQFHIIIGPLDCGRQEPARLDLRVVHSPSCGASCGQNYCREAHRGLRLPQAHHLPKDHLLQVKGG